jgi:hypothetical protein
MAEGAMQAESDKTRSDHARAVKFQERLPFAGLQREYKNCPQHASYISCFLTASTQKRGINENSLMKAIKFAALIMKQLPKGCATA